MDFHILLPVPILIGKKRMDTEASKERKEADTESNGMALVRRHRSEILRLARERGAHNVRVFGSMARDEQVDDSDIDFLVEMEAGRSLFDRGGLLADLQDLLGRPVDVVSASNLRYEIRDQVLAEARPL